MKLLSRIQGKEVRETAAETGREAFKGTGRGARRGAKRGFSLGALKGSGEGAVRAVRDRVQERFRTTRRERAKSKAESARDSLKGAARSFSEAAAPRRSNRKKKGAAAAAGGAVAAAGAYFLDPENGRRRRHVTRDRIAALVRGGQAKVTRQAEYRKGQAGGLVETAKSKARPEKPAPNDQALAERVQSEIFRPADAPKGSVNVNVENGVVYLRGEVEQPDQANDLVRRAESVDGVTRVESLLHPPDTPAPKKGKRKATA